MTIFLRTLFGVLCLLCAGFVSAQENVGLAETGGKLPPDVRLVIDVSGSMKRNDPNNLRQPAIELLVQLLPEGSRAGVWTFGKWINMLVPHKPVTTEWRDAAQKKSGDISSVGLYTNIGEALEKASYDALSTSKKYRTSIILLTDGMVDIDKSPDVNKREWRRIVDEVLPKLKEAGITIHTIALSDNADKNLMNKLSLSTDGLAEVAHTADDLMRIFLKTFDAAVPSEQVPLTDNQFVIDSSVEEFTALIFRKNPEQFTELVGPDQNLYSASFKDNDVKWHRADNYDLITVKRPLEGEWGVKADMDPESRITVVSNLNLRVKPLPSNVFKGQKEELSLFLQEDGKNIARPEFLSLMDIDAAMEAGNDEFDIKQFWTKTLSEGSPPAGGHYSQQLPTFDKDGIYQLSVVVDGKTFVRQFSHQFTVRQTFGAEVKQVFTDGKLEYVLVANSYNQNIDIPRTQVAATIISPEGRKKIRPLISTDVDTWKATLLPDVEGEYSARIKAKGYDVEGNPFDITLEDIKFNYSLEDGFVEDKEPFFDESAESEPTAEAKVTAEAVTEEQPVTEEEAALEQGMPMWMLYATLGVGNVLLFGLAFLLYKKIMGKNVDILDQFSDEAISEDLSEEGADDGESEPEMEEEPPMEDLDPIMDELGQNEEEDLDPALEPEMTEAEGEQDLEPKMESEPDMEMPIDDLESMAETQPEGGEEDDDMVAEMLKAQGLDLAEDELDEAISTLIDDLDADDLDEDEDKKE
ncbi:VWA domain-containing protein [Teredinibacter haidensis]|mgnify:CR=1 FL=1|uniref:VWA domain-containing protein n=1 Tax=Teredinibacter haidensis TaxID=2731755 RepID=UPI000948AF5B|nr:VWA domain-containing protein [Teredinibacter haidensis]